jgi:hypothetical protein
MLVQSIIDGIVGVATTCAFSKEKGGAKIAAGISVVGFIFDLGFEIAGGVDHDIDPMQKTATRQDIKDAVKALETNIDDAIKTAQQTNLIDSMNAVQHNMDIARDAAGQKGTNALLNGPTPVWNNAACDQFFDPVMADPSDLQKLMENLTQIQQPTTYEVILYCHAASVFFMMCKMGMVWEINNNFKAIQGPLLQYDAAKKAVIPQQRAWDAYENANPGAKHGLRPPDPKPTFATPEAGDPALGSWVSATPNNPSSYLGYKHSAFANKLRGYLKTGLAWAEPAVRAFDAAWQKARLDEENKRLAVKVTASGGYWQWSHADAHGSTKRGTPFKSKEMAEFQAEFYRGSFREADWAESIAAVGKTASKPDGDILAILTRADLDKLLLTMDKWRDMQALYNGLAGPSGKTPPKNGWLI